MLGRGRSAAIRGAMACCRRTARLDPLGRRQDAAVDQHLEPVPERISSVSQTSVKPACFSFTVLTSAGGLGLVRP